MEQKAERRIDVTLLELFERQLVAEEKSRGTIELYLRDLREFDQWLENRTVSKEAVCQWKISLIDDGRKPVTVNRKLAALNRFFIMMGWEDCKVKTLKLQKQIFRDTSRELTRKEYEALLLEAERQGRMRIRLLMETICSTGIRVSEVKYITVEALASGRAEVRMKGKIRVIMIPGKLCRKLSKYCKRLGIRQGEVFVNSKGNTVSRKQIWAEMKVLCEEAGIEATKVFPHNLRHLFARCFYKACGDLVRLADVLGHSNVETTRIYLMSTGIEHAKILERLHLISQIDDY